MKIYSVAPGGAGWVVLLERYDDNGHRVEAREITSFDDREDAEAVASEWSARAGAAGIV